MMLTKRSKKYIDQSVSDYLILTECSEVTSGSLFIHSR